MNRKNNKTRNKELQTIAKDAMSPADSLSYARTGKTQRAQSAHVLIVDTNTEGTDQPCLNAEADLSSLIRQFVRSIATLPNGMRRKQGQRTANFTEGDLWTANSGDSDPLCPYGRRLC